MRASGAPLSCTPGAVFVLDKGRFIYEVRKIEEQPRVSCKTRKEVMCAKKSRKRGGNVTKQKKEEGKTREKEKKNEKAN